MGCVTRHAGGHVVLPLVDTGHHRFVTFLRPYESVPSNRRGSWGRRSITTQVNRGTTDEDHKSASGVNPTEPRGCKTSGFTG